VLGGAAKGGAIVWIEHARDAGDQIFCIGN
jgi:hypothetical protein